MGLPYFSGSFLTPGIPSGWLFLEQTKLGCLRVFSKRILCQVLCKYHLPSEEIGTLNMFSSKDKGDFLFNSLPIIGAGRTAWKL